VLHRITAPSLPLATLRVTGWLSDLPSAR
jgi:hypothetical protein